VCMCMCMCVCVCVCTCTYVGACKRVLREGAGCDGCMHMVRMYSCMHAMMYSHTHASAHSRAPTITHNTMRACVCVHVACVCTNHAHTHKCACLNTERTGRGSGQCVALPRQRCDGRRIWSPTSRQNIRLSLASLLFPLSLSLARALSLSWRCLSHSLTLARSRTRFLSQLRALSACSRARVVYLCVCARTCLLWRGQCGACAAA